MSVNGAVDTMIAVEPGIVALYLDAQRRSCPSGARVHHTVGFGGGGLGEGHDSRVHAVG